VRGGASREPELPGEGAAKDEVLRRFEDGRAQGAAALCRNEDLLPKQCVPGLNPRLGEQPCEELHPRRRTVSQMNATEGAQWCGRRAPAPWQPEHQSEASCRARRRSAPRPQAAPSRRSGIAGQARRATPSGNRAARVPTPWTVGVRRPSPRPSEPRASRGRNGDNGAAS
jgi:hypothetical protein